MHLLQELKTQSYLWGCTTAYLKANITLMPGIIQVLIRLYKSCKIRYKQDSLQTFLSNYRDSFIKLLWNNNSITTEVPMSKISTYNGPLNSALFWQNNFLNYVYEI